MKKTYIWDTEASSVTAKSPEQVLERLVVSSSVDKFDELDAYISKLQLDQDVSEPQSSSEEINGQVKEFQAKVLAMKKALQEKLLVIKSQQAELLRLQTATQRRSYKFKSEWQNKMEEVKNDAVSTFKKQQQLIDRLNQDVKELEQKFHALEAKLHSISLESSFDVKSSRDLFGHGHAQDSIVYSNTESELPTVLIQATNEIRRKISQSQLQLQKEEKSSHVKLLQSKEEQLKKQAAEVLAPTVDELVKSNKETVFRLRDELSHQIEQQQLLFEGEFSQKLHDATKRLQLQLEDRVEVRQRRYSSQLDQLTTRQAEEMTQLRSDWQRERHATEEAIELTCRQEDNQFRDTLQQLHASESRQIDALHDSHQQQLSILVTQHENMLQTVRIRCQNERLHYESECREEFAALARLEESRSRHNIEQDVQAETADIISKMRADINAEREATREALDQRLQNTRLQWRDKLFSLEESVLTSSQHLRGLQDKIKSNKVTAKNLQESISNFQSNLNKLLEGKKLVTHELTTLSNSNTSQFLSSNDTRNQNRLHELQEWQNRVENAKQQLLTIIDRAGKKEAAASSQCAMRLESIQEKVDRLISGKDRKLKDLKQRLEEIQSERKDLEEQLDVVRENHVHTVDTSNGQDIVKDKRNNK